MATTTVTGWVRWVVVEGGRVSSLHRDRPAAVRAARRVGGVVAAPPVAATTAMSAALALEVGERCLVSAGMVLPA